MNEAEGFLWSDMEIGWVPATLVYFMRYSNVILAVGIAGLSVTGMRWSDDRWQRARFLGMMLFALTFALDAISRLDEPATLRGPFYMMALAATFYGYLGFLRQESDKTK